MTKTEEPSTCTMIGSTSLSYFECCINCSTSLTLFDRVNQIGNEEKLSNSLIIKAIFSVFKLKYLEAFESLQWHEEQVEGRPDVGFSFLCPTCTEKLNSLYEMYNDFLQLGKVDSFLSKKLTRLDEIIDCHQQKTINCDLIATHSKGEGENDCFHMKESGHDTAMKEGNNQHLEYSLLQPRVVMTRLPEKYSTKIQTVDMNNDGFSSDEDVVLPDIKMELEINDDTDIYSIFSPFDADDSLSDSTPLSQVDIKGEITERCLGSSPMKKSVTKSRLSNSRTNDKSSSSSSRQLRSFRDQRIEVHTKQVDSCNGKSEIVRPRKTTKWTTSSKLTIVNANRVTTPKVRIESVKSKGKITPRIKTILNAKCGAYLSKRTKHPNPCWHCPLHFTTPEDCLEHTKNEHLKEVRQSISSAVVCERCCKITKSLPALLKHQTFCESIQPNTILPKRFQCDKCALLFATSQGLWLHQKLGHGKPRPFSCDMCPYTAKTAWALMNHKNNKHTITDSVNGVSCDICGFVSKNERTLYSHKYQMHSERGHQDYRAKLEQNKIMRKINRINAPKASTLCDDCGVDFYSRLALSNHRRVSHGDNMGKNHICDQCGRRYNQQKELRQHIKTVHSEDKIHICHLCGKSLKNSNSLRYHVSRSHTEEGRLKFNQLTREKNRRRKIIERQLAELNPEQTSNDGQQFNSTFQCN